MKHRKKMVWIWITLGTLVTFPILGLGIASWLSGTAPELGVDENGELTPCPDKPNCVCSCDPAPSQHIQPFRIPKSKSGDIAFELACDFCASIPGAKRVASGDVYARFEVRSRFFRIVDDVEILFDQPTGTIHFRSASRVGHSDLGVNRHRIELLKKQLEEWAE